MSKVYGGNGERMTVQQILDELCSDISYDQTVILGKSLVVYESIKRDDMRLAHAILDTYRFIDSTTEQGIRVRKLMDNLMTKYQKSSGMPTESSAYHNAICDLIRKSGLKTSEVV